MVPYMVGSTTVVDGVTYGTIIFYPTIYGTINLTRCNTGSGTGSGTRSGNGFSKCPFESYLLGVPDVRVSSFAFLYHSWILWVF